MAAIVILVGIVALGALIVLIGLSIQGENQRQVAKKRRDRR